MVAWTICLQIANLRDIHKLKIFKVRLQDGTSYKHLSVILSVQLLDKIRVVLPSIVIN